MAKKPAATKGTKRHEGKEPELTGKEPELTGKEPAPTGKEPEPTGRRVSLALELQEVGNLIFAVGMVANEVGEPTSKAVELYGLGALRALISVVQVRVRLIEGALLGETDPGLLWTDRNDAPPEKLEGDVVLPAW